MPPTAQLRLTSRNHAAKQETSGTQRRPALQRNLRSHRSALAAAQGDETAPPTGVGSSKQSDHRLRSRSWLARVSTRRGYCSHFPALSRRSLPGPYGAVPHGRNDPVRFEGPVVARALTGVPNRGNAASAVKRLKSQRLDAQPLAAMIRSPPFWVKDS